MPQHKDWMDDRDILHAAGFHPPIQCPMNRHLHPDNHGRTPLCEWCIGSNKMREENIVLKVRLESADKHVDVLRALLVSHGTHTQACEIRMQSVPNAHCNCGWQLFEMTEKAYLDRDDPSKWMTLEDIISKLDKEKS